MLSTVKRLLSRKVVWMPLVAIILFMVSCGVLNFMGTSLFPKGLPIPAAPTLTPPPTATLYQFEDAFAATPTNTPTPRPTANATQASHADAVKIAQTWIAGTSTAEAYPTATFVAGLATETAEANVTATQETLLTLVAFATQESPLTPAPTATYGPSPTPTNTPAPPVIWIGEDQNIETLVSTINLVLAEVVVYTSDDCRDFSGTVFPDLPKPNLIYVDHRYGDDVVGLECVEAMNELYNVPIVVTAGNDVSDQYSQFNNVVFVQTNKEDWSSVVLAIQQALGLAE